MALEGEACSVESSGRAGSLQEGQRSVRPWASQKPGWEAEEELRLLLALQTPCWGGASRLFPACCHAGCTPCTAQPGSTCRATSSTGCTGAECKHRKGCVQGYAAGSFTFFKEDF